MKRIISILIIVLAFTGVSTAQCNGGHSTSSTDAWISCAGDVNPNPARSQEHWIMYEFNALYTLQDTHLWNYNTSGSTDNGVQEIAIDISTNGVDWVEWGLFSASEAPGTDDYMGEVGPDFGGLEATHVLISVNSNWGGDCYGFAEIKMNVAEGATSVEEQSLASISFGMYPNPASETLTVQIEDPNQTMIRVLDLQGALVQSIDPRGSVNVINIGGLPVGIYLVQIVHNDGRSAVKRLAVVQ